MEMIEVFIWADEAFGGFMRSVKKDETLREFFEHQQDRAMREDEEHERLLFCDLVDCTADMHEWDDLPEGNRVKWLESRLDEMSMECWSRALVPAGTRYIFTANGCSTTLDGWCGIGGDGYIEMEDK